MNMTHQEMRTEQSIFRWTFLMWLIHINGDGKESTELKMGKRGPHANLFWNGNCSIFRWGGKQYATRI